MAASSAASAADWRYWFDFILFPLIAVALPLYDCRSLAWCGWWLAGLVLFGFVEYWVHRVLLHGLFWHGAHERHHKEPHEYVVFPVWLTPAIFAGFFIVMPLPLFAGLVAGYSWFLSFHHAIHHWNLRKHPFVRRYAAWHAVHHRGRPYNFGISHPLFDFVFGTYRSIKDPRHV
jgi:dihydroceramide fatty acyl 2-hydroxylase